MIYKDIPRQDSLRCRGKKVEAFQAFPGLRRLINIPVGRCRYSQAGQARTQQKKVHVVVCVQEESVKHDSVSYVIDSLLSYSFRSARVSWLASTKSLCIARLLVG